VYIGQEQGAKTTRADTQYNGDSYLYHFLYDIYGMKRVPAIPHIIMMGPYSVLVHTYSLDASHLNMTTKKGSPLNEEV